MSNLLQDIARFNNQINPGPSGILLRQATVTSVETDSITIDLGLGDVPGVARLSSYSNPLVDDTIWVLESGPIYLVLGTVIAETE